MNDVNRLIRILKHRWLDEADARRALGADGLRRLEQRVAASERAHTGELRVCIEAGLPLSYLWRSATARERAISMFSKLRVWDTENNNGVLIYLLLAEHRIEIVADRGITQRVPTTTWQQISDAMVEAFQARDYEHGLLDAVDRVGALLAQNFPVDDPAIVNPNELPDRPDIR
ncbi:MAG: TPM domain-containing protein [Burkholderiaceae bacterium]|nr:TPM domain-containing protein [Burkholderiaceae bacterium]